MPRLVFWLLLILIAYLATAFVAPRGWMERRTDRKSESHTDHP